MKYVVVLGDGMADCPMPQLGDKTPLECAKKPNIDNLARKGEVGMVKTVPDGIAPGSDVANLSVLGYNPKKYYTGRSPLEAVSIGVKLEDTDTAFRCNLVTLSDDESYEDKIMVDYSSDEISTQESRELMYEIEKRFGNDVVKFYPGISYRHCMVIKNGPEKYGLTPPHDISDKPIKEYLPKYESGQLLLDMMKESNKFLGEHPVNKNRISRGLRPANSIWLWGQGKKLTIPGFFEKYGVKGSVISAVDLIKGIGLSAGMRSIDVEGATGNIHTNFKGKADAALKELENGQDFVYIHVEAPDECGHRFEIENKVKSIELIDEKIVGTLLKGLEKYEDYRILVMPDHPTPLSIRTHSSDPVPYIIYQKNALKSSSIDGYTEKEAAKTGLYIDEGYTVMDRFLMK